MSSAMEVISVTAALGSLIIGYVQLNQTQRAELKTWLVRWATYFCSAGVGIVSVYEVIQFGTSDAPLTRRDVLWLLLNIWNAVAYLGCGIALAAVWRKLDRKKRDEEQNVPVSQA